MARDKTLPRIIIDSCLWVTFFCYESPHGNMRLDALDNEPHETASRIRNLIDQNMESVQILMPTAVYAEVLGIIRGKGKTPAKRKKMVDFAEDAFKSWEFLFVELDEDLVEESAPLVKEYDLHGIDATILAAAKRYDVRRLYSSDSQLLNVGASIPGLVVSEPPEPEEGTLF